MTELSRAASRQADRELRPHKHAVIDRQGSVEDLLALADQLYSVADVLVDNPRLRRALGHPSTPVDGRVGLVGGLLAGKVGPSTVEIAEAIVRQRWSSPWDMTDAFETAGDDALFAAAEREQVLDRVVDELFRFERILDAQSELAVLLDEKPVPAPRRIDLLHTVLAGRTHAITEALLDHAIGSQRKQSLTLAIDDLLEEAAARQARSLARVISAVELTAKQTELLTTTLSDLYGRPITVRTAIAPGVRGGLIIRIGDEVIDGSVSARIAGAHRALIAESTRAPHEIRTTRQGPHR